ncbi:MAG: PQQ-dependent sugar dehydrogenase [Deltaproteobacteria bacterium]|nr:PQQ-dependent sugar dehydrogenase [Deltaproteobacteria bacterium]
MLCSAAYCAQAQAQNLAPTVSQDLVLERIADSTTAVDGPTGTPEAPLLQPTAAEFLPTGELVVIEKGGRVLVQTSSASGLLVSGSFSVRDLGEQGLLGMAVDPLFSATRRLYFFYSLVGLASNRHRVSWARLDPTTHLLNTSSVTEILHDLYGPDNHNGGGLRFGPDGLLYIGVGDSGCNCSCNPGQATNFYATCLSNMSGKILRIDRDGHIPSSNPLVGTATVAACGGPPPVTPLNQGCYAVPDAQKPLPPRTEIYNWGLRNPWRFAFDELTGYLWIGDVGERTFEEIDISKGPAVHHGWPFREGAAGQSVGRCAELTPQSGFCQDPAWVLDARLPPGSRGSITGGIFSNQCGWPTPYQGLYWFGDFVKQQIYTVAPNATRDGVVTGSQQLIADGVSGVVHFFTDGSPTIYFVTLGIPGVWRIRPRQPQSCATDAGPEDAQASGDGGRDIDGDDVLGLPDGRESGVDSAASTDDARDGSEPQDAEIGELWPVDSAGGDASVESSATQCGCRALRSSESGGLGPGCLLLLCALLVMRAHMAGTHRRRGNSVRRSLRSSSR